MRNFQKAAIPMLMVAVVLAFTSMRAASAPVASLQASGTVFHFVMTADSRDDYTVLPALSHKMVTLNPVFGFFAGDLCGSFDVTCINNQWKPALDGNNRDGILAKTFVGRGNHDNGSLSAWQGLWDFQGMASRVGATNYTAPTTDATYSFDYGNSHFAVIDLPLGGSSSWTSGEISWLDTDLTAAERRGLVHEFIFSHGPMYGVTSEHGSEQPTAALKAVLNKHPISAGFHGHEHITAYTHVTPGVEAGINDYQQFTLGRAGAPAYTVDKPVDWSANQNAFADVAINGSDFTVTIYGQSGAALFSKTFTGAAPAPAIMKAVYRSDATTDGQVLESSETSSVGGTLNSAGTIFKLGDDASNRQNRAILSFNTAGLPDNAVITSVKLKIHQSGQSATNPYTSLGNIMADVTTTSFSSNAALQIGDFQAAPGQSAVLSIANNPLNGWYSKALGSAYFNYINKTGLTQFRLRFATDDNNNGIADFLKFYSGDYTTTPGYRPALIVRYYTP